MVPLRCNLRNKNKGRRFFEVSSFMCSKRTQSRRSTSSTSGTERKASMAALTGLRTGKFEVPFATLHSATKHNDTLAPSEAHLAHLLNESELSFECNPATTSSYKTNRSSGIAGINRGNGIRRRQVVKLVNFEVNPKLTSPKLQTRNQLVVAV